MRRYAGLPLRKLGVVRGNEERGTRELERENRETVAQDGQTKRQILKYLVSFR